MAKARNSFEYAPGFFFPSCFTNLFISFLLETPENVVFRILAQSLVTSFFLFAAQLPQNPSSLPFYLTWRFYDEIVLASCSGYLLCLSDHLLYFSICQNLKNCMIMPDIFNSLNTFTYACLWDMVTSILFSSTLIFRVFSLFSCNYIYSSSTLLCIHNSVVSNLHVRILCYFQTMLSIFRCQQQPLWLLPMKNMLPEENMITKKLLQ